MSEQPNIPAGAAAPPAPSRPPAPGDKAPREDDRRIVAVEEIFRQMMKAIKSLTIYAHNPQAFENFVGPVHGLLTKFLKAEERLPLKIEPHSFRFLNAEVYRESGDEQSLTYKFYRDGVRKLVFRDGLTLDEMRKFVSIASAGSKGKNAVEDTVALLWKAGFENIEYVVVEGLSELMGEGEDGADGKMAEVEVEKVTEFVTSRLRSESDDVVKFARVAASDLNLELTDVQSVRGVVTVGEICGQEFRDAIQMELHEEDEKLMMSKVLIIIFALVKYGFDDSERDDIAENLAFLLDSLLLREDFKSINSIIGRFDELNRDPALGLDLKERVLFLKYRFVEAISSESRLDRLKAILASGVLKDPEGLAAYLLTFTNDAYRKLPSIMEGIEIPENLKVIGNALSRPHPLQIEVVQGLLGSGKLNMILEGLRIASQIDFPQKGAAIARLLSHPNGTVRLEALRATASVRSEEAKATISKALDDPEREVRTAALEALRHVEPDWAGRTLARVMGEKAFQGRPPDEQQRFFNAAAGTAATQVGAMFAELMQRKSGLFNKKEVNGSKLMVVEALKQDGSVAAFKVLQSHAEQKYLDTEVKAAVKKAMDEIRQKLVGG